MNDFREIKVYINSELDTIKSSINSILKSSEQEFLVLGNTLAGFSDVLDSIEIECNTFVSEVMGDVTNSEVKNLMDLLKDLNVFIDKSKNSYNLVYNGVSNIRNVINDLQGVVRDFNDEHSLLKYLNFSVKKESAKIDSAESKVFTLLSKNIEDLAIGLESSLKKILQFIKELIYEINLTKKIEISASNSSLFSTINDGIIKMVNQNDDLKQSVEDVGYKFVEINDYISQVVVSLQKHDIIRQQFEHIVEAFNFLEDKEHELTDIEYVCLVEKLFEIQLSQIDHSKNEIDEARHAIEASIDGIYEKVCEMAPTLENLDSRRSSNIHLKNNPIEIIENGIVEITDNVKNIRETESNFLSTINKVNNRVKNLNEFISEIEVISSDIKLISFNSQIASLHIGDMGKTLRVISDEIGSYTFVVAKKSSSISNSIKDIVSSSDSLVSNMYEDDSEGELKSKRIINKAKYSIDFFNNINKTFFKSISKISDDNGNLISNINIMKQGLRLEEFTDTIVNVKNSLLKMSSNLPEIDIDDTSVRSNILDELIGNYTMNSERKVYDSVINNGESSEYEEEEFDVELF